MSPIHLVGELNLITQEEIRAVVEATIKDSAGMSYFQLFILVLLTTAASFFGTFLKEKAKSSATKSDIRNITHQIEEVKKKLAQDDRISSKKYELKYNACLNLLGILDAHISHIIINDNNGNPATVERQYSTIEEAIAIGNES